uniref:MFS domain-containing protein n=1 Tax=Steinernema glaseri TaxID=37863 RepID=A0A1I7Y3V8_9BILA
MDSSEGEATRKISIFRDSTRYAVLILSIICMTLVTSNCLILNFTIICMGSENGTTVYDYSQTEKGWLFSAVAIGALIGALPITELITLFGMRKVKTGYGMISVVATFLCPLAASYGFVWLFAVRVVQGFAWTVAYSATGDIPATWATPKDKVTYMAVISAYLQLAPMFTMPVAGAFCVSPIGWTGVYYLQGLLTLFFFGLFYYFYRDSPEMHKSISAKELGKIESGKVDLASKSKRTPYLAISCDLTIIGVWMSWVGGATAYQLLLQYGPTYLNKVLHYEVASTGFATAFPFALALGIKICAGPFSEWATCVGARARLILFTIAAQGSIGLCFVFLALVPPERAFLGWCAYAAAIAAGGMNCVAMFKCAQLVSCQYISFVMAVLSIINSLSVLILPPFVSYMVPTNAPQEWAMLYYAIAGLVLVTNAFFCFVCKAKPASWTREASKDNSVQPRADCVLARRCANDE